jgi:CheY-like chemotaxis protein
LRFAELTGFALHVIEDDTGYLMGKRILVADDSLTIQQAFAMVMEGSGYALSFAKSVEEALATAKKDGRPDLVLSDVALGSGSGYDLCAEIKAETSLHDVPVYILASTQTPYDEARGRKVGADGHMAKPFESQALLDAVASALATPAKPVSSALPQFAADYDDNTARISSSDLPVEDDDSYGEITIERGTMPSPSTTSWTMKPPARPSAMRPAIVTTPPTPAISQPVPRPSLIPGARPAGSLPTTRTGTTPQPAASTSAPPTVRPPINRTMMGFPSVKPPVATKPTASPPPIAMKSIPSPVAAMPSRPIVIATPPAPAAPTAPKPLLPNPPIPIPPSVTPSAPRPVVPRLSSTMSSASIPSSSPSAPVTRRVHTPIPPSVPTSTSTTSPSLAAVVSSVVDQKVAALSARGPDYEAIAKLSREIIEQVVWEVVPELAEAIIRQEVDRLASVKK